MNEMKLKDFIRESLTDIAQGIREAQEQSSGCIVNPTTGRGTTHSVHFDLTVQTDTEGKAGISVLSAGMSEKTCNRITFDVNLYLESPANERRGPKRTTY